MSIDVKNPIPIDFNSNIFYSSQGKQYVPFLNPKDNFARLLVELKLLSPTTLSCVSSKAQYCVGKGIYFKGVENPETHPDFKEFSAWSQSVNRKQQSLNDIMKLCFDGKFTTGNGFVEIVRGQVGKKRFVKVFYRPMLDCRLSLPDEDDICNSVYISKQFRKTQFSFKELEINEVPFYSTNVLDQPWVQDDFGNFHTAIHIKEETGDLDYYGLPSNVGAIPHAQLEYKAARFNLDDFDNNLVLGGVVVLKGATSPEEAKKIGKDFVFSHSGDGKRNRWAMLSSEVGLGDGAEILPFEKNKEGSFIESDTHVEEKIYTENKWNKLLIGGSEKKSIGQGNSAYIRSVFDIANETVITPEQEYIIDKLLKPLLRIHDEWVGTNWSKYEIGIKQVQPITFLGDIDVNAIITKDEGREIIGMKPTGDQRGKEFITAKSANTPKADPSQGGENV